MIENEKRVNRRAEDQWHLDKRVPISLILAIVAQTGAALWWASATNQRVSELEKFVLSRVTLPDRVTRLEVIAEQLPKTLDRIEGKLDRLERVKMK